MAIGERIKSARLRAGLNLRELADMVGVSAQAISKYERGLDVPGSKVLIQLARALHVRVEYILRPLNVSLSQPSYRSHRSKLRVHDQDVITAQVQDWLERYLSAEELVSGQMEFHLPAIQRRVESFDDIEKVALELRVSWELGLDPITNLIEMLESKGIKVGVVEGADHFEALTLMANETIPVIVVKDGVPGDRQRLSMAHELGHLVLEMPDSWEEKEIEKAAYRFAGAFLAPAPSALRELGSKRQRLDLYELHLLKHKYGMSMQAWIHRAQDLGIISGSAARQMYAMFVARGWKQKEPSDAYPTEKTERFERLIMRAIAEDIIAVTRAEELLGKSLLEFWKQASNKHDDIPLPANY